MADLLHKEQFVLPEGHPLAVGYDVVHCNRCGMVYADTAAVQGDYDRYYTGLSKYADAATSTGAGESQCDAEQARSFDVVVLCHVLEYVRDLQAALEGVRTLLSTDGCLFVEVPDASRARIAAYIDSNPANRTALLQGKPVLAPDRIPAGDQPIVVASLLHGRTIAATIARLGLPNPIVFLRPESRP
jgi:hypothetical protein